jgi:hypothetical protein
MKSWTCLVCIISVMWFEFQIQTHFLFLNQFILTLVLELEFLYKCAQLNSLLCRSCWDRILENSPDSVDKVWTPLKFIEVSNCNLFQNWKNEFCWEIRVDPTEKVVQKFENFWSKVRPGFLFYKSKQVWIKEKYWFNGLGPAHGLQWHGLV